jgi:hypothetical protein
VAHAYTPGLRVTARTVVRRERRLPLKGHVLVQAGDPVGPHDVVARTELPGNVQTVNLASRLGLEPARVLQALRKPVSCWPRPRASSGSRDAGSRPRRTVSWRASRP